MSGEDKVGPQDPNDDADHVLRKAALEIAALRKANQHMQVRLQMFDDCMSLLKARRVEPGAGHQEDNLLIIQRYLAKREAKNDRDTGSNKQG